jgi:hypothetical protein
LPRLLPDLRLRCGDILRLRHLALATGRHVAASEGVARLGLIVKKHLMGWKRRIDRMFGRPLFDSAVNFAARVERIVWAAGSSRQRSCPE